MSDTCACVLTVVAMLRNKCTYNTKIVLVVCIVLVAVLQYLSSSVIYTNYRLPWEFSSRLWSALQAREPPKSPCPIIPSGLKGRFVIDTGALDTAALTRQQSHLLPGGWYKPSDCTARHRVAIIIPYRDRESHLRILLQNLHPFLQRQQLDYGIYIIELEPSVKFNRAALMNIGFMEASKLYDYQCFIFHDVDLVPEDDRNLYTCPESPRHMSAGIDKYNYRPKYKTAFGGVTAIKKEHFLETNGFSNKYFGWGYEDDDFYRRVMHCNLTGIRYYDQIARYQMLDHTKDTPNPYRFVLKTTVEQRRQTDGLNTLKYEVLRLEATRLFTWIYVTLNQTEIMGESVTESPVLVGDTKAFVLNKQVPTRISWIPPEFNGTLPDHLNISESRDLLIDILAIKDNALIETDQLNSSILETQ